MFKISPYWKTVASAAGDVFATAYLYFEDDQLTGDEVGLLTGLLVSTALVFLKRNEPVEDTSSHPL